jgi:uncharacterized protein (TIGR04255 family)
MPFPNKKRVKFNNNPLIEVVCQLTFSQKLYCKNSSFENDASSIHDELKSQLPFFTKAKNVSIEIGPNNQDVKQNEVEVFEYSSQDQTSKIVLSPESVALVTTEYKGWESFLELLNFVVLKLEKYPETKTYKRIGLRYKDVIERSSLGLSTSEPWHELLNDKLTCLLQNDDIAKQIQGLQSNFTMNLPDIDEQSRMNSTYGIVSNAGTKEICFMIDSDFYVDGEINNDGSKRYLDAFNVKSRNFFQWCIKDKLYKALQPKDI